MVKLNAASRAAAADPTTASARAEPSVETGGEQPDRLMSDQKEEARSGSAQYRAEQVGPQRELANRNQLGPDVRDHDEERCARRMGNPQRLGRSDELPRVPERHRGRQSENEDGKHCGGNRDSGTVGRPVGLRYRHAAEPTACARAKVSRAPAT